MVIDWSFLGVEDMISIRSESIRIAFRIIGYNENADMLSGFIMQDVQAHLRKIESTK